MSKSLNSLNFSISSELFKEKIRETTTIAAEIYPMADSLKPNKLKFNDYITVPAENASAIIKRIILKSVVILSFFFGNL